MFLAFFRHLANQKAENARIPPFMPFFRASEFVFSLSANMGQPHFAQSNKQAAEAVGSSSA